MNDCFVSGNGGMRGTRNYMNSYECRGMYKERARQIAVREKGVDTDIDLLVDALELYVHESGSKGVMAAEVKRDFDEFRSTVAVENFVSSKCFNLYTSDGGRIWHVDFDNGEVF